MKTTIFLFALSMVAGSSMGQTLKTYSGLYEGGKATYTYYEDENGERVKHGNFTFNYSDPLFSRHAEGRYNNNKKNGKWTYISKNVAFKTLTTTIINYANGNMEGQIIYTNTYGDGEMKKEYYQMKNNRVIGTVKGKISGQFDDEGFPDGTWTKSYESGGNLFTETEQYVHGLLIVKQTKNESTGEIQKQNIEKVDPKQFIAAYNPDKDSTTTVGNFICKQRIYIKKTDPVLTERLPEYIGGNINGIFNESTQTGYDTGQNYYQGIPFKDIVIIDKIETPYEGKPDEGTPYTMVEQMPQFPGGKEALKKYLKDNLNYPTLAKQQGIHGRVILRFVINRDGSISDAQIVRSLDSACDEEALRLINSMPRWIPGRQNGNPERVFYTIPVEFLND